MFTRFLGGLAVVTGMAGSLFALLVIVSRRLGDGHPTPAAQTLPGSGQLGVGFLTTYLLPFEIISVHLLVVLIGAAYLARAKRKPTGGGGP